MSSPPTVDHEALARLAALLDNVTPMTIGIAAGLGVADHLRDGPRSVDALADATGADRHALFRVLRLLSSRGVFRQVDRERFELTPVAQFLRSDHPISLREALTPLPEFTLAWSRAVDAVRSGRSGWELALGAPMFSYLAEHPAAAEQFNRVMFGRTRFLLPPVLDAYDWSDIRTVVDVGGGNGQFLAVLLSRNPGMHAVLFDLPSGLSGAEQVLDRAGVADRCELVDGDFFEFVPGGADAYVLANVLHDWDDHNAIRILRSCRQAMHDGARLLLIDYLVPAGADPHPAKTMDLLMLMYTGGRERTETELRDLLDRADFALTATYSPPQALSITEARPAETPNPNRPPAAK
jgi:SAM-dependent methyltransferase